MVGVVRREIERMMRQVRRRVLLMVGRAVVTLIHDGPDHKLQTLQIVGLKDEVLDEVQHLQPYGYTAHPHPNVSEALLLALGGMREHPVVAAVFDRLYRPTDLEEGEVCLYTSEHGASGAHRIRLKQGRKVHVEAASEIRLECGSSTIVMTPTDIRINGTHIGLND